MTTGLSFAMTSRAGKSDRLTDTTLMNIPRFVEELDSLRRALTIDKWFVNGQSWGTVLALEYYKAHPERVAGIVFGGSVFDWRAYVREVEVWTKQMTDSSQRAIAAWKQGGSPDAPEFKAATEEFYSRFVWRRPVTVDLDSTMAEFGNEQYNYMQGAFEFVVTGTLRTTTLARTFPGSRSRYSPRPASSMKWARRPSRRTPSSFPAPDSSFTKTPPM